MNRFALGMMISFVVLLMLSASAYTFSKCGWKALFLGNGAGFAAVSGMCDE
jgi:hypothetical protein